MAIARQSFTDAVFSSLSSPNSGSIASWAAGETCLVLVRWYGTQTISSVTFTGESNLTVIGSPQTGGPDSARSQWAILSNVTGTGSKTVTVNFSGSANGGISVWRLSGCDTTGARDVSGGASGTSGTLSVNLTTTVDAAAIFAGASNNSGDITAGAGYTLETVGDSFWYDSAQYDIDVGTAGSKTVSATISSGNWVWNAIAIKPAGGASGAISGSAALVFGAGSSSLTGAGALAGSAAQVFGAGSSTLAGAGALAGASANVFGAGSSTLTGAGALAGEAAITISPAGAVAGAGALAGAAAITIVPTGVVDGAGALAGAAAMVFGGSLAADVGAMEGSANLAFGGAGVLAGTGALEGVAAMSFDGSATAAAPTRRRAAGRNYIIRGRRYFNVTNDELALLIARDLIDVTREDIRVVYAKKKARPISKDAWTAMKEALTGLEKVAPTLVYDESDDEEALLALL